jgi:hypothetical protein
MQLASYLPVGQATILLGRANPALESDGQNSVVLLSLEE